nr:putative nuclease HARBI1 isoform X2 [Geotrypetes seraphini]XP_033800741.1 putative nuclease HARBI1 isoform X3 [Geotrypetes seraphini]
MFALQLYWLLRRRRRLEAAQRRDRGRERVDGARGAIVGQERANAARGAVARRERGYAARGAVVDQARVDRDRRAFVEQKRVHAVGGAVAAQGSVSAFRGAIVKQERTRGTFEGQERAYAAREVFVGQKRVHAVGVGIEGKRANAAFVGQEQGRAGAAAGAFVGQGRVDADPGAFVEQGGAHVHGAPVGQERKLGDASPGTLVRQGRLDGAPGVFIGQDGLPAAPNGAFIGLGQQGVAAAPDGTFVGLEQKTADAAPDGALMGLGQQELAAAAPDGAFMGQEVADAASGAPVEQEEADKQARGRRKTNGQRRQRVFNTRTTLLGLPEEEVVRRYGLSSVAIMALYEDLKDDLDPLTGRSHAIPGLVKLLSAIHFMASGSFQNTVAVVGGMEQSTFSRCFRQVLQAMTSRVRDYIQFPTQKQQWQDLKSDFCVVAGLPNVIGIIDCMHVALIPPRDREASFRNSKHFHSLNIQMVCDAHMNVLNVVPRFPGSCHDSYVLRHSALFRQFEEGMYGQGWLLGDAGYGCRPWLLTPVTHPKTPAEKRFNEAHISTHSVIERTFRALKSRFRCLDKASGALQYCPLKVAEIVLACCILHNFAVRYQVSADISPDLEEDPPCPPADARETTEDGSEVRSSLIVEYFA